MRDLSSSVGTEWDDDDESGARGEDAAFCDILQDFVRLRVAIANLRLELFEDRRVSEWSNRTRSHESTHELGLFLESRKDSRSFLGTCFITKMTHDLQVSTVAPACKVSVLSNEN